MSIPITDAAWLACLRLVGLGPLLEVVEEFLAQGDIEPRTEELEQPGQAFQQRHVELAVVGEVDKHLPYVPSKPQSVAHARAWLRGACAPLRPPQWSVQTLA